MPTQKKTARLPLLAISAGLFILLGLVVGMPYLVLYDIQQALEQKAGDKVNKYINYPLLRENLKSQLNNPIDTQSPQNAPLPLQALGQAMAASFLAPLIDEVIKPENLKQLIESQDKNAKIDTENIQFGYSGLNEFQLRITDAKNRPITILLTRKNVIFWEVSNLIIPPELFNNP